MSRLYPLICIVSLFTFMGCQSKMSSPKKRLQINLRMEPLTLDPRKGYDVYSSTIQMLLFDGLTEITPKGDKELSLASKIALSENRKVYTFTLKKAHWSNGDLITSFDMKKSLENMLSPNFPSPSAHMLYPIKNSQKVKAGKLSLNALGLETPNSKTLIITLEKPTPYFLKLLSFCTFFPVHEKSAQNRSNWSTSVREPPIVSGAFQLKEWKKGSHMLLTKNPHYWNNKNIHLDEIFITFIQSENTALALYEKGDIQILGDALTRIPQDAIPSLKQSKKLQKSSMAGVGLCFFNTKEFPFQNVNLRKALSYAIDRQSLIDHIVQAQDEVATSCVPSILKKNRFRLFFQDRSRKEAKKLFEKALLELNITRENLSEKCTLLDLSDTLLTAEAIQQQWRKVLGLYVPIERLLLKAFLERVNARRFTLANCIWTAQYNDPVSMLSLFQDKKGAINYTGWEDPKYIQAIEESFYEPNESKRLCLLEKAEEIFANEMPAIPLFHKNMLYLKKEEVKDFFISKTGIMMLKFIRLETN